MKDDTKTKRNIEEGSKLHTTNVCLSYCNHVTLNIRHLKLVGLTSSYFLGVVGMQTTKFKFKFKFMNIYQIAMHGTYYLLWFSTKNFVELKFLKYYVKL